MPEKRKIKVPTPRVKVIGVRVSGHEESRLEQARRLNGSKSLSDFMRQAALEKAAILGVRNGQLSGQQSAGSLEKSQEAKK